MTTKHRKAAAVAEQRILELTSQFAPAPTEEDVSPSNIQTVQVTHLDGIEASYQTPRPYDSTKPTLVLINSFMTSSDLFRPQFEDEKLNEAVNMISIEPLGHGQTRAKPESWTFWDSAKMNLEVLEKLSMTGNGKRVFVLGTSQGGFIAARMAILAPEKITAIIPLGTSMDAESERSLRLGCWNGRAIFAASAEQWTKSTKTSNFQPSKAYCDSIINNFGFGSSGTADLRDRWIETIQANYRGEDGKRRAIGSALCARDRDSILDRLDQIKCPVLWMHGTKDASYSLANTEDEIKMFTASPDARLVVVQDGTHFLSASHPTEVNEAVLQFVQKYGK